MTGLPRWSGPRALRRVLAERRGARTLAAALLVTLLCVALGGWNRGFEATVVVMSPGSVWLASADRGELTLLDTTSPAVVRHLPMANPGDPLAVGRGPTTYALNGATGALSRIDGRTFAMTTTPGVLPRPSAGPMLLTTGSPLYVLDTVNDEVRPVDTAASAPGESIRLPTNPPDGGVGVDDTGRMWLTDTASRDVAWLANGVRHVLPGAAPAPGAVIGLAPGGPVLVSGSEGTVQQIDDSGAARTTAHLRVRGDRITVTGEDTDVVDVVIGSDDVLVRCSLEEETCADPITLGSGTDLLGRPVAHGGLVFVPDHTNGSVIVVDPAQGAVVAAPVALHRTGAFELFVHDDAVVFNDPLGPDAGVVDPDGTVRSVDKHARTAADPAPAATPPPAPTPPPTTPSSSPAPPTADRRSPRSVTPTPGPTATADDDQRVSVLPTTTPDVRERTQTTTTSTSTATPTSPSTSGRPTTSATTPTTSATTSVTTPESARCDRLGSGDGLVDVDLTADGGRSGLTFCRVLINNGDLPITGAYPVKGQVLGLGDQQFTIVGRGDPKTCDALGRPPVEGTFDQDVTVDRATGRWSFTEDLGYEESVTIARNFEIVTASSASLTAIRAHQANWVAEHGGDPTGYPGMDELPGDTKILATFGAPAGEFPDAQPCGGE